jgi:hypothetical protein
MRATRSPACFQKLVIVPAGNLAPQEQTIEMFASLISDGWQGGTCQVPPRLGGLLWAVSSSASVVLSKQSEEGA